MKDDFKYSSELLANPFPEDDGREMPVVTRYKFARSFKEAIERAASERGISPSALVVQLIIRELT